MKAYAIFSGGGVKGAALAGCFKAASDAGIDFVGVGGCSAGAIVAYLVAIGTSVYDLEQIMINLDFTKFLDDGGAALAEAQNFAAKVSLGASKKGTLRPAFSIMSAVYQHRSLLTRFREQLGLYDAHGLKDFVLEHARARLGAEVALADTLTFDDLAKRNAIPLKIVASDLFGRRPAVFSNRGGDEVNGSVLGAIRASMSYPLVFKPVAHLERQLADGGLATNLPLFLFERERAMDGLPLIAFDLASDVQRPNNDYTFGAYSSDLFATALESSDHMQQRLVRYVHHVRIDVPSNIKTLDFALSRTDKENLFNAGVAATHSYLARVVPHWSQAASEVERLQAVNDLPPALISHALRALTSEVERTSGAAIVRAHVMLPTGRGSRIVVYQAGMSSDPDEDLELANDAGCSGRAWTMKQPTYADLAEAKTLYSKWKMTAAQQNKVRSDRQSMMSVPIFDTSDRRAKGVADLGLIGVLSVDSATALSDTGWIGKHEQGTLVAVQAWADIIGQMLR